MNGVDAPPATTVFVSYSRADEKRAKPFIDALERAGYAVWWDGLLGGGERFARSTAEALDRARAVVVLWSKTSIESHWVHDEATAARDAGRLVPLSLDGSTPPLGFRQFQVIDVSRARRDGPEMRQMLEAVAALHDAAPQQRTARRGPEEAPLVRRRGLILGGTAVAAAGAGAAVAWRAGLFGGPATVAVLPFADFSPDKSQAYFADGLAAEIRATLTRNAALSVVGQASSDAVGPRPKDAKSVAKSLSVDYLLDGNVLLAPGRVRVSAELTDGRTGFSRWSQTFDRTLDDIFTVQSEIATAVTEALTWALTRRRAALRTGATKNVAAFDAYLRGKAAYALAAGPDTDQAALARFDEAIAADPAFAAAHAARARTLAALANEHAQGAAERKSLYDDAIAAARKAVALGPDLADAQSALGFILVSGRLDIRGARAPYERSYQLGQGDADVLSRYGLFCGQTGRFDPGEAALQHARELDPLNPRAFYNSGYLKFASHHFADALQPLTKALELNPKMSAVHGYIGYSLMLQGKLAEAEAAFRQERDPLTSLPGLAMLARRAGRNADADAVFADLVAKSGDNGLYQQGQILAQWGEVDRALHTLQRARAAGDPGLFLAGQDPLLDPLRKDGRFSRLLGQLGFV
jgi:TolB-like protein/tetratricopeptide (TPR) repeat protein